MTIPLIYNVRSVKERMTSTLVAILAIAGVVAVFIAMLSMAYGFQKTLASSGTMENVIILRGGANSEMESTLPFEQVKIIGNASEIQRLPDGQPLLTAEVVVIAALPLKTTETDVNVSIRGTSQNALTIRNTVRIVEGRYFRPGVAEIVVGKNMMENLKGFKLGNTVQFGGQKWHIVGIMDAGKNVFDSEIWCDANVLNQVYKRQENVFQSVTVRLISPQKLKKFRTFLARDSHLTVEVKREIDYYNQQSEVFSRVIKILGFLIAGIMGIGAVFGALNTMYSAVTARVKEIATLSAIGFSVVSIGASFLIESLFISLIGGLLGSLIIFPIHGFSTSTINLQTFSHVAFTFTITPGILVQGMIFAMSIGAIGGLLPAYKATRLSVVDALRGL